MKPRNNKDAKDYLTMQVFERSLVAELHRALSALLEDHKRRYAKANPAPTVPWNEYFDSYEVKQAVVALEKYDRYFTE
ncbi:MAG: hypothetical protein JHC85_06485 [Chthoniobacterales bacterium]|nr:hypothetical protein [Chthoniobacterales bacterium]